MHALKVVREAGVRRVIAKGGLEPVSRRPPLRDEPANRYPVTRDDYGLAVLDCIEDVGEASCRLRGSYCDHDYILSDLVCLCVYKLRGLLRACSALVRWPYPWRSPSGTRIPATGAAKPGPRARGDRVCMASVAGARGSAEPFDLSQCGGGFDVLHAWEGADVLSPVSVEVAGVAGDGGGDHVVRPRDGRREADGRVAGEGGPDMVQAGRVHAKPEV